MRQFSDMPTDVESQVAVESVEFLITEEAAAYLRTSVGSIRNATSNGKIPPHCYRKFGRRILYLKDELRKLVLESQPNGEKTIENRSRRIFRP